MRNKAMMLAVALGTSAFLPHLRTNVVAASGNLKVAMADDCNPNADWGAGMCLHRDGSVTKAEFGAFLVSTLSPTTVVGHPSWRMDPGYAEIDQGDKVKVENTGGRNHTFTKVKEFGGGDVPPLRVGLTEAPECVEAAQHPIGPGVKAEVSALDLVMGDNRFQCCFHSWMHAVIKVVAAHDNGNGPKH